MSLNFETPGVWQDDLLWCPSQCYLEIWIEDTPFVIYLRWRSSDPWTLSLIEGVTLTDFVLDDNGEWIDIDDFEYTTEQDDLEIVHSRALESINRYFENIKQRNDENKPE